MKLIIFLLLLFSPFISSLKVSTVLPGPLSGETSAILRYRDSITVIFDKPAIALGADWGTSLPDEVVPFHLSGANVPGTLRYLTTSMARFDPLIDWPNDLEFTLKFHPITGPLGDSVDESIEIPFSFKTDQITFSISNVINSKASALTDNTWSYSLQHLQADGTFTTGLVEVPPESTVELSFSHEIDIEMVGSALSVVTASKDAVTFSYENCTFASTHCLAIKPEVSSYPDEIYTIVLPGNTQTSQYSGLTADKGGFEINFSGLFNFRFPFMVNEPITNNKLALYLRHGLKNGAADLAELSSVISFDPSISFKIDLPYSWMLTIEAIFEPLQNYTLTISSNSITDGFDLPLQPYSFKFTMGTSSPIVLSPTTSDNSYYYENTLRLDSFPDDENWTIFGRNVQKNNCFNQPMFKATNVDMSNLAAAIASIAQYQISFLDGKTTTIPYSKDFQEITFLPPFGTSGLWLNEQWSECYPYSSAAMKKNMLVSRSTIKANILYSSDIYIWLTDTISNDVVSGATVSVWGYNNNIQYISPQSVQKLSTDYVSDDDGLVHISNLGTNYIIYVVVNHADSLMLSTGFNLFVEPNNLYSVNTLITDRSFYSPGDNIYIKGYYHNKQAGDISIPAIGSPVVSVNWGERTDRTYPLTLNSFGSFSGVITIPTNATSTSKLLYVSADHFYAYKSILISSPRIPTVTMSVSSSEVICKPNTPLPISISLNTYVGTPVENGAVQLRWSVVKETPAYRYPGFYYGLDAVYAYRWGPSTTTSTEIYYGTLDLNVDENGKLDYSLTIDKPVEEGTTIKVKASYFSPTKEEVEETLSLPIAYSPMSLSLKPTVTGPIVPAYKFGIFANVQDLSSVEGKAIKGVTVNVGLYEWDGVTLPDIDKNTGQVTLTGTLHGTCNFETLSTTSHPGCTDPGFQLPEIGTYLLVGTIVDEDSYTVTTMLPVGNNLTTWQQKPRSSFNYVEYSLDKVSYTPNDVVNIEFFSPFPESRLFIRWGNHPNSKTKISSPAQGLQTLPINLGSECATDCKIDIIQTSPRIFSIGEPIIPTSVLFDPTGPTSSYSTLDIKIDSPPKYIDVSVEAEDIVQPGETSHLTVTLRNVNGQPTSGEVAVFMVDKAVLDLKPNPITHYNDTLINAGFAPTHYYMEGDSHTSSSVYMNSRDIIKRRFLESNWYNPEDWSLFPKDYLSALDVTDEEFFAYYKSSLSLFPVSFPSPPWTPPISWIWDMAMASEMVSLSGGSTKSADSVVVPELPLPPQDLALRSKFLTTALFVGSQMVDDTGKVQIPYTLPDNVGTYEIRVYAINSENIFGVGVKDQISRRDFSLQASSPRIVRFGDQFSAGVSLTITDPDFEGSVTLEVERVCQLFALSTPNNMTVSLSGSGPHLIEFKFVAVGTGTGNLIYKVKVPSSDITLPLVQAVKDAVMVIQDVAPQQEPVSIATSMAISQSSPSLEGYTLPDAVPYSGNLTITVGVGRLPAIQAIEKIIATYVQYPPADVLLGRMASYIAISKYQSASIDQFTSSLSMLEIYTVPDYGLQFYNPRPDNYYYYTNIRLQAFAINVANEASQIQLPSQVKLALYNLVLVWKSALLTEIARQFQQVPGTQYMDYHTLSYVYLALGTTESLSFDDPQLTTATSIETLISKSSTLSADAKTAIALALLKNDKKNSDAATLLSDLMNTFRTQGRTSYIAEEHNTYPNFLASALGLQAYILQSETSPLIEKLANFVALEDHRARDWGIWWLSGEQASHFMLALSKYDQWKQNTNPDLTVTVDNEGKILLQNRFQSTHQTPIQTSIYFEKLSQDGLINFEACCVGEASVVFGASFVPTEIPTEAIDRGITVSRIIQLVDPITNKATGGNIVEAEVGQLVLTTIEIILRDYSNAIKIVDAFPGSLNPLDDSIYDTPDDDSTNTFSPYWWFWGSFSQKEFLLDKVVFTGQNLYAGTYTVKYYSLVSTPGKFVLPPTLAYDVFQPELMGSTAGGTFSTPGFEESTIIDDDGVCLPWVDRQIPIVIDPPTNVITPEPNNIGYSLAIGLTLGIVVAALIAGVVVYFKFFYTPAVVEDVVTTI